MQFAVAACLLACLLLPGTAWADATRVARGDSKEMSHEFAFTFWVDYDHFAVLPPGEEKGLLDNPIIRAPDGVEVTTLDLTIRQEEYETKPHAALKGPQEVQKYKQYVIEGNWNVRVGEKCPTGKQTIRVEFPGIASSTQNLGAGKDPLRGKVPIGFDLELEVFPDQAALEKAVAAEDRQRWPELLALVLIWSLVAAVVIFAIYACVKIALLRAKINKMPPPPGRGANQR